MKDFKVTNVALTVNPLNKTPEQVKPLRTPSSMLTEFPFLLPLHTCVTRGKKSNDNSNRMFTLHPIEPAVQIILKSSLGFAPTSLTLAAEACSPTIHQS